MLSFQSAFRAFFLANTKTRCLVSCWIGRFYARSLKHLIKASYGIHKDRLKDVYYRKRTHFRELKKFVFSWGFGQNSRGSRKFLLAKFCIFIRYTVLKRQEKNPWPNRNAL